MSGVRVLGGSTSLVGIIKTVQDTIKEAVLHEHCIDMWVHWVGQQSWAAFETGRRFSQRYDCMIQAMVIISRLLGCTLRPYPQC